MQADFLNDSFLLIFLICLIKYLFFLLRAIISTSNLFMIISSFLKKIIIIYIRSSGSIPKIDNPLAKVVLAVENKNILDSANSKSGISFTRKVVAA